VSNERFTLSLSAKEIKALWQEVIELRQKNADLETQLAALRTEREQSAATTPSSERKTLLNSTAQVPSDFLQQITDNIPLAIFWQDCQGVYLGCNQLGAAIAGCQSAADIVGKTDADLAFSRKQIELFNDLNRQVLITGVPLHHAVHTLVQPDGRQIWLDVTKAPLQNPDGQIISILTAYEEVTERLMAQVALQDQWQFLHQLIDSSPDLIMVQDWSGQVTLANRSLARFLGAEMKALVGYGAKNFFPSGVWERFTDENQEVIISGEDLQLPEEVWVNAQGENRWLCWTKRVLPLPGSEELGVLAIAVDVTSQIQANAAIRELNEQLRAENLRMGAELEVTRRLQQMILPREEELAQITELDIAGFMEPATEVGGDYYDVVLQPNGRVSIGIGDVTGHGLESGMVMLMAQTALRTLLATNETDPVKRLEVLNQILYTNSRRMQSGKSMTLTLLEYEAGKLRLSGQHEELILVRLDGQIEVIDTFDLGFPLGIEPTIAPYIQQIETPLLPGEVAVLYTDGVTEAVNANNEIYGVTRLHRVLRANQHRSAQEIRQAVVADIHTYIADQEIFDDITLVVIKQKNKNTW